MAVYIIAMNKNYHHDEYFRVLSLDSYNTHLKESFKIKCSELNFHLLYILSGTTCVSPCTLIFIEVVYEYSYYKPLSPLCSRLPKFVVWLTYFKIF